MPNYYHSGIEAYCKSVSKMIYGENNSAVWLKICQDVMPDRDANTIARVWTLSNVRGGRSCRQSIFEQNWLGGLSSKQFVDEAIEFAKRVREAKRNGMGVDQVDKAQFITINGDDEYIRTLIFCKNNTERKAYAYYRCEYMALSSCADSIIARTQKADSDIYDDDMPAIAFVVEDADAPVNFYTNILVNVEQAFSAEAYTHADAQQFGTRVNDLLYRAHFNLHAKNPKRTGFQPYRDFLMAFIAGLIYGPAHPLALGLARDSTQDYGGDYDGDQKIDSKALRITQIFDNESAMEGFSQTLTTSQLAFIGRSNKASDFTNRCDELFATHEDIKSAIDKSEILIFPISDSHDTVGNVHGMILFEHNSWRYYDLQTMNGTSIQSRGLVENVFDSVRLRPGDRLRLGAPKTAHNSNVYWGATVLRISQYAALES